jgi:P27 family predicted phage terminase small subunit
MKHKPPSHLQPASKLWWSEIINTFYLESHHLKLLQLACEAWERCQEARKQLAEDGITIEGREGGMRPHPAIAIERDSVSRFAALVKQLGLDDVGEPEPRMGRPPASTKFADFAGNGSKHAG